MFSEFAVDADIIITTVPEGCPINIKNIKSLKNGVILAEAKYGSKADLRDIAIGAGIEYLDGKAMLFGQFVEAATYMYPLLNVTKGNHERAVSEIKGEFIPKQG